MTGDPIAYFITWTTYGTWLSGDERGWTKRGIGHQPPDLQLHQEMQSRLAETPLTLTPAQRQAVEEQVRETWVHHRWILHAVHARTNHVHVVVTSDCDPDNTRDQLKAWCTRRLKKMQREELDDAGMPTVPLRERWWTERGSAEFVFDEDELAAVIEYVMERQ